MRKTVCLQLTKRLFAGLKTKQTNKHDFANRNPSPFQLCGGFSDLEAANVTVQTPLGLLDSVCNGAHGQVNVAN